MRKNAILKTICAVIVGISVLLGTFQNVPYLGENTLLEVQAVTISQTIIDNAISWGRSQIGSTAYNNKCQAFVWQCFNHGGFPNNSAISFASAKLCGDALITNTDYNAPKGACVFFDCSSHGYGHIGISLGDGTMIHAGHKGVEITNFTNATYLKNYYWLTYRGWGVWGSSKGNTIGSTNEAVNITAETGDVIEITETNAVLRGVVKKPSSIRSGMQCGVQVGTAPGNYNVKYHVEDVSPAAYNTNNGTSFPMWFNANNEMGVTLKAGTRYYYRMFALYGGKYYYGSESSFVTADTTKPQITSFNLTSQNKDEFTVKSVATDNAGVKYFKFYCWGPGQSRNNGCIVRDVNATNGTATTTFKLSELKNYNSGAYAVDVYAYDAAGNVSDMKSLRFAIDRDKPQISNFYLTSQDREKFTVKAIATDNVGVKYFKFIAAGPGQNSYKGALTREVNATNGTATTTFTLNELNNFSTGEYGVDVYAYDAAGNVSDIKYLRFNIDRTAPVISDVKLSNISETGYTVSCTVTDNEGVARVQFPTWTTNNGQDDIFSDWWANSKAAGTKNGNTYTYRVNISDHNNEYGVYKTEIHAYDAAGNTVYVKLSDVTITQKADDNDDSNTDSTNTDNTNTDNTNTDSGQTNNKPSQPTPVVPAPEEPTLYIGQEYKDENGLCYRVTSVEEEEETVQLFKVPKNVKSVNVPDTVEIDGVECYVDSVATKAFYNCKKLQKVTLPDTITRIEKKAFSGCKKLKTVRIYSDNLEYVGKYALKGIARDARIYLNAKVFAKNKKLIKKSTTASRVVFKKM